MKSAKNKIRQLACGGIFAIAQAGTALAAGNESSFTISGAFTTITNGISPTLQEAFNYLFDNVSSGAWGALVIGILILLVKAGLSQVGTDSNPADAVKHESAIVGVLRVAGVALFAIGVIYMLHQKFA